MRLSAEDVEMLLAAFERLCNMESGDFYARFKRGEFTSSDLGQTADLDEWARLFELSQCNNGGCCG